MDPILNLVAAIVAVIIIAVGSILRSKRKEGTSFLSPTEAPLPIIQTKTSPVSRTSKIEKDENVSISPIEFGDLEDEFIRIRDQFPERVTIMRIRKTHPDVDFKFPRNKGEGVRIEESGGTYRYIFTERGQPSVIHTSSHRGDILFWLVSDMTRAIASDYEVQNRLQHEDSRRQWMALHVKLLRRINDEWADRIRCKYEGILKGSPFYDEKDKKARVSEEDYQMIFSLSEIEEREKLDEYHQMNSKRITSRADQCR